MMVVKTADLLLERLDPVSAVVVLHSFVAVLLDIFEVYHRHASMIESIFERDSFAGHPTLTHVVCPVDKMISHVDIRLSSLPHMHYCSWVLCWLRYLELVMCAYDVAAAAAAAGVGARLSDAAPVDVVTLLDIVDIVLRDEYPAVVRVRAIVGPDVVDHSIVDDDVEGDLHPLFGYHEDCTVVFVSLQCLELDYTKRAIALRSWLHQTWLLEIWRNYDQTK